MIYKPILHLKRVVLGLLSLSTTMLSARESYFPKWFRTPRECPRIEIQTAKTLDVTKFGAKPDDGKNDWQAITHALATVQKSEGDVRLFFPRGTYDIRPDRDANHCFSLSGCRHFVIEGDSVQILIQDPTKGFLQLTNCEDGLVCGFSVDYSTMPYTQGQITAVDAAQETFEVKLSEGFPSPLEPHFTQATTRWGSVLSDGDTIRLKREANNLVPVKETQAAGPDHFRFKTSTKVAQQLAPGDLFILIARYNGRPTYSISGCRSITLRDNINYAGPAGSFGIGNSSAINVLRCSVLRKPGRYISQNADCVHVTPGSIGPWIEDCTFEGQMDDAINIKTALIRILRTEGDDQFEVSGDVSLGDSLSLFNPREGILLGRCCIEQIEPLGKGQYLIRVDRAFSGLHLTQGKDSDMFFNDNRSNESFVIRNNIFRNFRRYGMLIQATHGVIEGNSFSGLSTGAITLQNSASWPEGFVPRNIVITHNTIRNCGFDAAYFAESPHIAPILIRTTSIAADKKAQWQGISHITLRNNQIQSNSLHSIFLSGATDCLLEGNRMQQQSPQGVYTENCTNITKK